MARQEIVQRRKDLSRIKQERSSATQERNDAIREAAEWKGSANSRTRWRMRRSSARKRRGP